MTVRTPVSDPLAAILDCADEGTLDRLAELLAPRLAALPSNGGWLLSPREAAARIGLHEKTVARMAREGRLPGAVKVGRGWRFDPDGLVPQPPARPAARPPSAPRERAALSTERASVRAIRGPRCT